MLELLNILLSFVHSQFLHQPICAWDGVYCRASKLGQSLSLFTPCTIPDLGERILLIKLSDKTWCHFPWQCSDYITVDAKKKNWSWTCRNSRVFWLALLFLELKLSICVMLVQVGYRWVSKIHDSIHRLYIITTFLFIPLPMVLRN